MNEYNQIIHHLSLIDGVGPATIHTIVERKPGAIAWLDCYNLDAHDWQQQFGCSERMALIIVQGLRGMDVVQKEQQLLYEHEINCTTIIDSSYPALLRAIQVPPSVLYWRGVLPSNQELLAVVGARSATWYGQKIVDHFIPELVAHQWGIVSGGALGIDSMAHRACLKAGGNTIVVLGSGLLHIYPASNKKLFQEVVHSGGALVSIFPAQTAPTTGTFPARNRVIAGLSKGCVVVQAAEKSGARITAQWALDQGREVFAVPGSFDDPLSAGCHALIQQGAKLVTSCADILIEFGQQVAPSADYLERQVPLALVAQEAESIQQAECARVASADSDQSRIMTACRFPATLDDLVDQLGIDLPMLQSLLLELQLAGKITQNFDGTWVCR